MNKLGLVNPDVKADTARELRLAAGLINGGGPLTTDVRRKIVAVMGVASSLLEKSA